MHEQSPEGADEIAENSVPCGLFIALAGARVVQSLLTGISARDPLAIVAAVVVLMAAASAAVLLPARRAARLNPAEVLKLG